MAVVGAEWGRGDVVRDGGVGQGAALLTAADALASAAPLIGYKAALVVVMEAHLKGTEQGEDRTSLGLGTVEQGAR